MSSAAEISSYSNSDGVVPTKRSWRTVFACWRGFVLVGSGKYARDIYTAYVAQGAPAYARMLYRARAHPNGRKLFRDKPDIYQVLHDTDYLASVPPVDADRNEGAGLRRDPGTRPRGFTPSTLSGTVPPHPPARRRVTCASFPPGIGDCGYR